MRCLMTMPPMMTILMLALAGCAGRQRGDVDPTAAMVLKIAGTGRDIACDAAADSVLGRTPALDVDNAPRDFHGVVGQIRAWLCSSSSVKIDDLVFHEFRHVPNTRTAAAGSKWGAGGNVDGCRVLFCGAQALGFADIGNPEWVEKGFDYENQQGISVSKILGFLKPKFSSIYENGAVEDFGVINVYCAQ
jgi:hypothetical protein